MREAKSKIQQPNERGHSPATWAGREGESGLFRSSCWTGIGRGAGMCRRTTRVAAARGAAQFLENGSTVQRTPSFSPHSHRLAGSHPDPRRAPGDQRAGEQYEDTPHDAAEWGNPTSRSWMVAKGTSSESPVPSLPYTLCYSRPGRLRRCACCVGVLVKYGAPSTRGRGGLPLMPHNCKSVSPLSVHC